MYVLCTYVHIRIPYPYSVHTYIHMYVRFRTCTKSPAILGVGVLHNSAYGRISPGGMQFQIFS